MARLRAHRQVKVGVVALILQRRRIKTVSASVDPVAEATKREQGERDLAVRKETEIVTKTLGKGDRKAATGQVLLAHDQKVEVQKKNKENPRVGK